MFKLIAALFLLTTSLYAVDYTTDPKQGDFSFITQGAKAYHVLSTPRYRIPAARLDARARMGPQKVEIMQSRLAEGLMAIDVQIPVQLIWATDKGIIHSCNTDYRRWKFGPEGVRFDRSPGFPTNYTFEREEGEVQEIGIARFFVTAPAGTESITVTAHGESLTIPIDGPSTVPDILGDLTGSVQTKLVTWLSSKTVMEQNGDKVDPILDRNAHKYFSHLMVPIVFHFMPEGNSEWMVSERGEFYGNQFKLDKSQLMMRGPDGTLVAVNYAYTPPKFKEAARQKIIEVDLTNAIDETPMLQLNLLVNSEAFSPGDKVEVMYGTRVISRFTVPEIPK